MPDLLNQPYEIISVYNVCNDVERQAASPIKQELAEEIADILGKRER